MKKKEALDFIRQKKGFIPYVTLFEIFEDSDEIPQALIDLECAEDKTRGNFMIVSAGLYEQLKNLNI